MRFIQICVDAVDDLLSFTHAINNWPAVLVSGCLSLAMFVAVLVIAPWVFVVLAATSAAVAGIWAVVSVASSLPSVRPKIMRLHMLALSLAVFAIATLAWPELVAGFRSATFVAASLAAVAAFIAHEVTRELSLQLA